MVEKWLKCSIYKGMFSDERAIKCQKMTGFFSVFVPQETVRGEINQEGTVKVGVFHKDNTVWAILPSPYKPTIPVCESQLT